MRRGRGEFPRRSWLGSRFTRRWWRALVCVSDGGARGGCRWRRPVGGRRGGGRRRAQMGALAVSCIRGGGAGISAEEWRSAAASCAVGSAPIAVAALSTVVAALVAAAMAAIGVRAKRALGTLSQPVAPTLTKPRVPARSLPRATTVRAPFRLPSADCRIRSARGARCVVARSADARPQDARRLPSTIRSPPPVHPLVDAASPSLASPSTAAAPASSLFARTRQWPPRARPAALSFTSKAASPRPLSAWSWST